MAGSDGGGNRGRERLGDRVRRLALKPAVGGETKPGAFDHLRTAEEIDGAIRRADDTERMVGLVAAPLAAAIGLLVTASLVANDPKSHLAGGANNPAHVNPSVYLEIGGVAVLLSVLMLAFAWWRKRLYLGIAMALYGLSVFNLRFWGFGVPFVMAGAWYLVRAFRLQSRLKAVQAAEGSARTAPGSSSPYRPRASSKRYTPKTPPPAGRGGRTSPPRPGTGQQRGQQGGQQGKARRAG